MKIRTTEQLIDSLAAEIMWRRKELTELRYLVERLSESGVRQTTVLRAAVALLYAHWEGFVKRAAELYLEFVGMQRCKNSELATCMLAIVLRTRLHAADESNRIQAHADVVEFFRTRMNDRSVFPHKGAIRTEANLSSTVFLEILRTLGFETSNYEPKSNLIDHELLAKRNHIAHGKALEVNEKDYLVLHTEVLELMSLFRNQLENAAATRQFKHAV